MREVRALVLAGLVLLVAACGGTTTAAPPPAEIPSATFTMNAVGPSGASGTGKVFKEAASFKVSITLTGLVPNSSHVSHVHVGTCANQGGIAYALLEVVADSSGNATATSTVADSYSSARTGWYVNVHSGPDMSETGYLVSVSCGDLPATGA